MTKMKIKGVHCESCKALVEDILSDIGAKLISWKMHDNWAEFEVDGSDYSSVKKEIESETEFKIEK